MSMHDQAISENPERRHDSRATPHRPLRLLIGAVAVLVSAYVHFYLYFKGGYRGIAPETFAGITISRAFAVNAIAGFLIAWALVISLRFPKVAAPAAWLGVGFAAATLAAYLLTRTVGLLGFQDDQAVSEALIAVVAELVALGSLGSWLAGEFWARDRRGERRMRSPLPHAKHRAHVGARPGLQYVRLDDALSGPLRARARRRR